jgi:sigma-E factor negative regulatory protein RseB
MGQNMGLSLPIENLRLILERTLKAFSYTGLSAIYRSISNLISHQISHQVSNLISKTTLVKNLVVKNFVVKKLVVKKLVFKKLVFKKLGIKRQRIKRLENNQWVNSRLGLLNLGVLLTGLLLCLNAAAAVTQMPSEQQATVAGEVAESTSESVSADASIETVSGESATSYADQKTFLAAGSQSPVVPSNEGQHEASRWLEKMGRALREESYEGIFTYMRGYRFDTVQVAHQFREGQEYERFSQLNGEPREIVRAGDLVVCNHANSTSVDLDHELLMGPFTRAFSEKISTYQAMYHFSKLGHDRVAGRAAVVLSITPKNTDRYGYRLWLDEETGLLLQSHLVNQGRVLEVFQFSRIDIGIPIDEVALLSALGEDRIQHQLSILTPAQVAEASQQQGPAWKVSWIPRGFRAVRMPNQNRVLFTDGLATFSVFVDRPESAELGELVTHMGGTVVISRRLKGSSQQITVVGEVPMDTARRVAESVEPVIY